jgi:DNA-binding NarL/FixJ family response regulator
MDKKAEANEICGRLDTIIKLMVAATISNKDYEEQVWTLSSAGFQPKEIADFLGKSPNAVSVKLSELRKKKSTYKKTTQEKP